MRAHLRKLRDVFVSQNSSFSESAASLRELLKVSRQVGSFVAISSEVDPKPLTDGMTSIALPVLAARDDVMTFRIYCEGDALERAAFNFMQPRPTAAIVEPDIVLTPLLGFDRQGNRLGQGAGHYDRYFAAHPDALRIGLAWSIQELDAVPIQPWDMPLDAICTECEWIVPAQSRLTR